MRATFTVMVAWALAAFVLTGVGRLISVRLPSGWAKLPGFPRFWLGFVGTCAFLSLWQLFAPVNDVARVLLVLAALAGWWLTRASWRESSPGTWALLLAPWLANRALGPETNADFASYFHETTNWFTTFALPPGLGNLHHRLGFNHAYYLYRALFETGPLTGLSQHVSDSLLFFVSFLVTAPGLVALFRADRRPIHVVQAILLVPVVHQVLTGHVSSGAADAGVFALSVTLVLLTANRVLSREAASDGEIALGLILAAGAVTTKLSLAATAIPLVVSLATTRRIAVKWAALATVLILIPWMARGVVMTGYPLFPSTVFGFDVSWRVPESLAHAEALFAQAYGRGFYDTPPVGTPWVAHWVMRALWLNHEFVIPLSIAGVALLLCLVRRKFEPKAWLCFMPGFAVWLLGAPEPRHAGALLWGFAAITFASATREWSLRWLQPVIVTVVMLMLSSEFAYAPWAPPFDGFSAPVRTVTQPFTLPGGDVIQDGSANVQCIDLDCTLVPRAIRFRVHGHLEKGFLPAVTSP